MDLSLAFLWHQHQPYYPDEVAGENPMPWVRLHGVKSYYGMALQLAEVPEMRCTINLVPSLLIQLLAYIERGASDRPMQATRIPAGSLSEDECLYLLDHFFMANVQHMIRPFPRYHELYQRRAPGKNTARESLRRFNERDFRDLQVWFNLAWIHPLAVERDAFLKDLTAKGRHFSEADKLAVVDKHLEILRAILPLHQQLAQRGQIELTTTPFFHPIVPLLLDMKLAREAMPDAKLPRYTGGYAEDAALHVRRAIDLHTQVFGKQPQGMWPAEGSVCQTMIPLLAQHGIRWIATDEEILGKSTQDFVGRDQHGQVRNPGHLYRPYKVREGQQELDIVFRDHALSDMVGFHYQRSPAPEAVDDFLKNLHSIRRAVDASQPALVSVILDGENCWEHYPEGGVPFLRTLYESCARSSFVRPVPLGEYLDKHPPRDTLPHLFAGSWISHNYAIWIGHEEDNAAWDLLHRTREHLKKRIADFGKQPGCSPQGGGSARDEQPGCFRNPQSAIDKAWEEIYIAEGSDWFWWYGEDHSSAQDDLFDYLFRKHLQNVYLLLGDPPPAELGKPIKRRRQKALHTLPRGFLEVKIDGRETFFEWLSAGRYVCQNERGTMATGTRGPIKEVLFGFNRASLLVRIDFDSPARDALVDFDTLRVGFIEPEGCELTIVAPGLARPQAVLRRQDMEDSRPIEVGIDRIVELALPFDFLGVRIGQPIQFYVELLESRQSRDRAPREGAIHLTCPSADFEQIMWNV